jgi:hypothetical protein
LCKFQLGEKVDGPVDYGDFGAGGRLLPDELSAIPVGVTREDDEDGRILGDNHCPRHRTMEPAKEALQTQLVQLSELIKSKLRSVVTLSLVVDPECCHRCHDEWCGCYEPTLDAAVVNSLIAFLPSSCVNLELNTAGTESDREGTETHMCATIQILLPQLRQPPAAFKKSLSRCV